MLVAVVFNHVSRCLNMAVISWVSNSLYPFFLRMFVRNALFFVTYETSVVQRWWRWISGTCVVSRKIKWWAGTRWRTILQHSICNILGFGFWCQNQRFKWFRVLHVHLLSDLLDNTSLGRGCCLFHYLQKCIGRVKCVWQLPHDSGKQWLYDLGYCSIG